MTERLGDLGTWRQGDLVKGRQSHPVRGFRSPLSSSAQARAVAPADQLQSAGNAPTGLALNLLKGYA